ncbi:MAG TPA: pilus assembly protein TadG-related protein [Caldimonas sp.]|nr:pilus assembly protein TadG-related protein [Caldimonas sp.]
MRRRAKTRPTSARRQSAAQPLPSLARRLVRDTDGATAVVAALISTALIGFVGLGSETGLWYYTHRSMQAAADSSALGAAAALQAGDTAGYPAEARAAAAKYGFVPGAAGVTVAVNRPPSSGNFQGNLSTVEVIIQQPQTALFSALFLASAPTISARAVALQGKTGNDCVLALDAGASASTFGNGTTNVNLVGCSLAVNSNSGSALNLVGGATLSADSASIVGGYVDSGNGSITTTHGITTGAAAVADPYANVAVPAYSGCDSLSLPPHAATSVSGGAVFCNGVTLNAGMTLNLSDGIYVIDRGALTVNGGATLNLTNATVVLTSSSGTNYATVDIHGGATINATAPSSGETAGLAFFQDRNAPKGGTNNFSGGTTQNITGAIYLPNQIVNFAGGTQTGNGCLQIVADEIDFRGNATLETHCTGTGVAAIGGSASKLVE